MTATDELRRLLDERGVEYEGGERSVRWRDRNGVMMQAFPLADGELGMDVWSCTPEQAIAATLGREPDDAAIAKLHDQMNAAMLKYEMAQGIEKRDGDGAIVVPWVLKMHALLEEAATLGSSSCTNNCTNGERTGTCLPHFWTHDGALHIELPKLPESISVRLPDQRDRDVSSASVWQFTLDSGTCHDTGTFKSWGLFTCSNCSIVIPLNAAKDAPEIGKVVPLRFCPNCGRKVVDE